MTKFWGIVLVALSNVIRYIAEQKHGGRKKGTPNRLTRELRTILKDVLYQEMEQLEERLNDLDPKDRMQVILKLMPYVFPKVMDVQSTKDEPLDFGI